MKKSTVYILLCIILLVGLLLRNNNIRTWPREGATFDEYAWTWLGINIIQKGIPISWSPHTQYINRTYYNQRGANFWLVQPYLEHPPLFGLIAGGYALLRGTPDMYHVRLQIIRELSLLLGVVSIYLVYLLASKIYSVEVGLWSSGIYALIPTVAVGSRILQNENFFIPVLLTIPYCLYEYIQKKSRTYFWLAAFLSGMVVLAKVPWVAAAVSGTLILLFNKKYREIVYYWAVVILLFSAFVAFGLYWDKNIFIALWKLQLNRYDLGFDSIFAVLTQPFLVDRYFLDGWIYAGWIAVLHLAGERIEKHTYTLFGLLGYLFIFVSAIPNEPGHGWYRYPMYPFLAIALGYYIHNHLLSSRILTSGILLLLGLSLLSHTWAVIFGFSYGVFRTYISWTMFGLMPIWFTNKSFVRLVNKSIYIQILAIGLLSVWAILGYNEQ